MVTTPANPQSFAGSLVLLNAQRGFRHAPLSVGGPSPITLCRLAQILLLLWCFMSKDTATSSSKTNPAGKSEGSSPENAAEFRPDRTHLLGAAIMFGILLIAIGAAPQYLFWVLAFPIVFVVWVLRSRTVVNEKGIDIDYAFGKNVSLPWEEVAGIGFRRARAFVQTKEKKTFSLPGVSFNSLPALEEASRGRIPDALSQGLAAADDKVRIVYKDGHEVLISKEEYDKLQAHKAAQEAQEAQAHKSAIADAGDNQHGVDGQAVAEGSAPEHSAK